MDTDSTADHSRRDASSFARPDASAVVVTFPRRSPVPTVLRLVLGAALATYSIRYLTQSHARWFTFRPSQWLVIAFLIAVALLAPLSVYAEYWRIKRQRFAFDEHGIWWWRGGQQWLAIRWLQLLAVGLSLRPRRSALELFAVDRLAERRFPMFSIFLKTMLPPRSGLPRRRYRIEVPVDAANFVAIEAAVLRHAPQLWLGRYR
ncbi:MAG TPA: hypothetical protein VHU91_02000 [Mycobacteriales bacterium]|jgi:hypothetical protein|nr:hypothetical protein [Mycobacteriales bacterium]